MCVFRVGVQGCCFEALFSVGFSMCLKDYFCCCFKGVFMKDVFFSEREQRFSSLFVEAVLKMLVEPMLCCCTVVTSQPVTVDMTMTFIFTQTS